MRWHSSTPQHPTRAAFVAWQRAQHDMQKPWNHALLVSSSLSDLSLASKDRIASRLPSRAAPAPLPRSGSSCTCLHTAARLACSFYHAPSSVAHNIRYRAILHPSHVCVPGAHTAPAVGRAPMTGALPRSLSSHSALAPMRPFARLTRDVPVCISYCRHHGQFSAN